MGVLNLPGPFSEVDLLAEGGDIPAARARLAALRALPAPQANPALVELLEVKLGLLDQTVPPQLAMNRLLTLMRQDAKLPGAHELYREASETSYAEHSSSMAHSHPPPPMKPKAGPPK